MNITAAATRDLHSEWEFPFLIFPMGIPCELERTCRSMEKGMGTAVRKWEGSGMKKKQSPRTSTLCCYSVDKLCRKLQNPDHHTVCLKSVPCNVQFVHVVYYQRCRLNCELYDWNLLPENMRKSPSTAIFKRSLKTFLFEQITHSEH